MSQQPFPEDDPGGDPGPLLEQPARREQGVVGIRKSSSASKSSMAGWDASSYTHEAAWGILTKKTSSVQGIRNRLRNQVVKAV
jgi:hypothetical protein